MSLDIRSLLCMASSDVCASLGLFRKSDLPLYRPWTKILYPRRKDALMVTQGNWLESLKPKRNSGVKPTEIKLKNIPYVKDRVRSKLAKKRGDKNEGGFVNLETPPTWYQQLSDVQEGILSISGALSLGAAVSESTSSGVPSSRRCVQSNVCAFIQYGADSHERCIEDCGGDTLRPYHFFQLIIGIELWMQPGDCVWVETPVYRFLRSPRQGEIVVFYPPAFPTPGSQERNSDDKEIQAVPQYVKRVIAVAGNSVEVTGGVLYLNDQPQPGTQV